MKISACVAVLALFALIVMSLMTKAQPLLSDSPKRLITLIQKSSADTNRVALLNKLGGYYIFKPGNIKTDLNNAMKYLSLALQLAKNLNSAKWINETLKLKGDCYLEDEDLVQGGACFKQVVDYYHEAEDKKGERETWRRWGDCITADHRKEKIYCYQQALLLVTNIPDWVLTNTLMKLGTRSFDVGDMTTGSACFQMLAAYYHKVGNKANEVTLLVAMGSNYPFGLASDRERCFQQAISLMKQLKVRNKQAEADALRYLAEAHLASGKLHLAEMEFREVLVAYKAIGYKKTQRVYGLLSTLYHMDGYPDKSIAAAIEAVKSVVATKDTADSQFHYFELAGAYYFGGCYDKSINVLTKSLNRPITYNGDTYYYVHSLNLRNLCLLKQGKAAEALRLLKQSGIANKLLDLEQKVYLFESFGACYRALKNYPVAEKYYLKMIGVSDSLHKASGISLDVRSNFFISDLYVDMGNYKKAAQYLKKIKFVPHGLFGAEQLSKLQLLRFKIDSANGRNISAIKHYQLYKKFNDSIYNATKNKQLQELEIKYDTEQKKRVIAGLQSDGKVQHAELRRINLQRNLTLIGIVLVVIIAGMAYKGFRQKKRSNLVMQVHQQEIDQKNESLQKINFKQQLLLIEKEWLLREIHHRVKNNLQTTISLLHMQSVYLTNEEALAAIRNSQRRMQAMSLIHQKLYQSDNMTCIGMAEYIAELVSYLKESFDGGANICFELQVQSIFLDVSQAIPLGLIINEAITNAIKYAFPDNRCGKIVVLLQRVECNYILSVADNGVGFRILNGETSHRSLGINLMQGLADQLQGEFNITNYNGTTVKVIFADAENNAEGFTAKDETEMLNTYNQATY